MNLLTQSSLIKRKMMNYNFVRRVTSSFLASLFALSVGVGSVKPVNSQPKSNQSQPPSKPDKLCANNFSDNSTKTGKLKIAVLDFEWRTVNKYTKHEQVSYSEDIRKGISNIVANRLATEDNFIVVRTANTDLQELRRCGVEAVIEGSVTQFYIQTRTSGGGLKGFAGVKVTDVDAYVKLDARMKSINTGKIILSAEGNGNESQSDNNIDLPFTILKGDMNGQQGTPDYSELPVTISVTDSDDNQDITAQRIWAKTQNQGKLLTLATQQAVEEIVSKFSASSELITSEFRPECLVAYVDREKRIVFLSKGKHSYDLGMKMLIQRDTQEILHPINQKVIDRIRIEIAEIEIVKVSNKSIQGKIISRKSEIEIGDLGILISSKENTQAPSSNQSLAKPEKPKQLTEKGKASRSAKDLQPRNNSSQSF